MTLVIALVIVAILQLAFIVLTLMLLFVTRLKRRRDIRHDRETESVLAEPLRAIMLGADQSRVLAASLSVLDRDVAVRALIAMGGARLSKEQLRAVASRVRPAKWVVRTLAQSRSGKWWKRMEAARFLAMVGGEGDEELLTRLITDTHPAVASAATAAIAGPAGAALVGTVVAGLPLRPPTVRLQQCIALRQHSELAALAIVARLASPATPNELRVWIQAAEILGTPLALRAVVPLASHPSSEVRTAVARALRSCFTADAVAAATRMLRDDDWQVRAAAARAVGGLNAVGAIPALLEMMRDESWWVRFRAALALADMEEKGRTALGQAQSSGDPYASDMAKLVSGLSAGSRLDLTSA